MPTNYNSDTTNELVQAGKLQQNNDFIPNQFADKIVPVINVNPKDYRRVNVVSANTIATAGDCAIYTTPADRDFFLTNLIVHIQADLTCDCANWRCYVQIDGATKNILSIQRITGAASDNTYILNFETPIKIDRGSGIGIAGNKTAGTLYKDGSIAGYTVNTA
jgi:hypothetical protein